MSASSPAPPAPSRRGRRARVAMAAGAAATVIGIFVAGAAPIARTPGATAEHASLQQTVGGVVLLVGWVLLAWGIHRFGRDGASE